MAKSLDLYWHWGTKVWGANRMWDPSSPYCKRWRFQKSPFSVLANAWNIPPGEYNRKIETSRNWRESKQVVEHVVESDTTRNILPVFVCYTGVAWLSSVRVVRCLVQSFERTQPFCCIAPIFSRLSTFNDCSWYRRWKWGPRQVVMTLRNWATHVLQ